MVKNLPAVQETWVQSLGWEDTMEEGILIGLPGESHGEKSLADTVHEVTKNQMWLSD